MISVIFKFLHVGAIALWSAGLIALPFVYVQRRGKKGNDLHSLHNFTRHFYIAVISPAAFVAIGSGTVLIFIEGTFVAWFSFKMLLVATMAIIHIFSGLVILRLFEAKGRYPLWRGVAVTSFTSLVVAGILALVLAKPDIPEIPAVEEFLAPGALSLMLGDVVWSLLDPIIAWTTS